MVRKTWMSHLCFLLLFLICGCTTLPYEDEVEHQMIDVISLKRSFTVLQETALEWDEDAYLSGVEIPLYLSENQNLLWLISAHFKSPNQHTQSISVNLKTDGSVTVEHIPYKSSVIQTVPIHITDDLIDSSMALSYFGNVDLIDTLKAGKRASLFLEIIQSEPDLPVVWRLSTNMGTLESKHIYIDAFSGDTLDIVR